MQLYIVYQKNTNASIKNLKTQDGEIAKQLVNQQGGTFIENTPTNPKEHCKLIKTHSGRMTAKGIGDNLETKNDCC